MFRTPGPLFAALVLGVALYLLARDGDPAAPAEVGEGRVVHIADGDTIDVRFGDGRRERVRYIGVDTPEAYRPGTPVDCFARASSKANARLINHERVRLLRDRDERDRYGRLLAYVYRVRDGLFVNEYLVRNGFARTLSIRPNVRYAARFARLQKEAKRAGRGLWRACPGLAERYG